MNGLEWRGDPAIVSLLQNLFPAPSERSLEALPTTVAYDLDFVDFQIIGGPGRHGIDPFDPWVGKKIPNTAVEGNGRQHVSNGRIVEHDLKKNRC